MMTAMICKYCCCCCDLRQHNPIKELFFDSAAAQSSFSAVSTQTLPLPLLPLLPMLLLLGVTYQIRGRHKKSMKMLRSEGGAPSQEILGSLHQKMINNPSEFEFEP